MYFLIKAYIFQKLEEFIFYLHSDIVFIFCRVVEKATKTNKQTNKQKCEKKCTLYSLRNSKSFRSNCF